MKIIKWFSLIIGIGGMITLLVNMINEAPLDTTIFGIGVFTIICAISGFSDN